MFTFLASLNFEIMPLLAETWEYCTTNEEQICLRGWFFAESSFAIAIDLFLIIVLVKIGAQILQLVSSFWPF